MHVPGRHLLAAFLLLFTFVALAENPRTDGSMAGSPPSVTAADVTPVERVELVAVDGDVDRAERLVRSLGGTVELNSGGRVQALVTPEGRAVLEAAREVVRVDRPGIFVPLQVVPAADLVGATQWHDAGFTGFGTRVAVVDAGFSGFETRLGTTLPAQVRTRSFRADGRLDGGTEHGRRAAEVVHALAPGAELHLVNFSTVTELSAAVDYLVEAGIEVVSFSLGYIHNGPGDGTGPVNDAVSRGVAAGQVWAVAAGNWAQQHWSGPFRDADGDTVHEFAPGVQANEHHFVAGDLITVSLRWDEPWGAACSDYDIELFGPSGALVRASRAVQRCAEDPVESLQVLATQTGSYSVRIIEANAEEPRNLNLMVVGTPDRGNPLLFHTPASSLSEPADHPGVITVGALTVAASRTEAPYSSRGPTIDGRFKPNFLAPTGATNPGSGGAFGGTSAAAPHVAAMLALLSEAFPGANAARLNTLLQTRAVGVPAVPGGSGARRAHLGSLFGVGPLLPPGAETARFTGALPSGPGVAIVVYQGPNAYPARFAHRLTELRPVRSLWRFSAVTGRWQGYVSDAPAFVNRQFNVLNNADAMIIVLGER